MLYALLYHRVGSGKYANPLSLFKSHFAKIKYRYQTLHPGDPIPSNGLCLTFDDATADFYIHLFPLLKKLQLKATLAVPTAFILDRTSLTKEARLSKIAHVDKLPPLPSPAFCTWEELHEMDASGLVHIASHSMNHLPLTSPSVDPEYELTESKHLLETKLQKPISTFVYPYGKFSETIHARAKKHYTTIMRIGNAGNRSWQNSRHLFYRIPADHLPRPSAPFGLRLFLKARFNYTFNTLRKK